MELSSRSLALSMTNTVVKFSVDLVSCVVDAGVVVIDTDVAAVRAVVVVVGLVVVVVLQKDDDDDNGTGREFV